MASLTDNPEARVELGQLAILLALDALFYFAVVPASIIDPEGMSLDQGLPPSFSAYLVAILAAILMVLRFLQLIFFSQRPTAKIIQNGKRSEIEADINSELAELPIRGIAGISAGLVFAYAVTPAIGFFAGGLILLVVLLRILGETRPTSLIIPPFIVIAMVWVLFEQLLSIRMPSGMLFSS